ncbi:MAG TPA: tetratricopeptide repeat protein, partial [Myxococcota bacterium]|nr:tetratricopeptide repeat protein [Myxococcota bacterium]
MATADEIRSHLERLRQDPEDTGALDALGALFPPDRPVDAQTNGAGVATDQLAGLEEALRRARTRGDVDHAAAAIEVYAALVPEPRDRIQHYRVLCQLYQDELMDERAAEAALRRILSIDPNDAEAGNELQMMLDTRQNWRKLAEKLVREAEAARSRDLATQFFERAAAIWHANSPGAEEVERFLKKSLEVDPRNRKASGFLRRLYSRAGRFKDLADHLDDLCAQARSREERIRLLLDLADVLRDKVGDEPRAVDTHQKVLALDPANSAAMSHLADVYSRREDWPALIQLYENALRARPRGEAEMAVLLQIGLLWWRKVKEPAKAEEYFKRLRKIDASHPAVLAFSREFYADAKDYRELINVLTAAQRVAKEEDERIALAREIADISAGPGEAPERAIESWKGVLRSRPAGPVAEEARDKLRALYRATHKWNALLEMLKEEQARLPESDAAGKVALLLEMVTIYRDELKLDVMVINSYHAILAIDPANESALGALAERYEAMGRFSDLIGVLQKRADAARNPADAVPLLRRIAQIWQERFNNHQAAVRPLERILELRPGDEAARDALREIYRSRRDWKGLLGVMRREADAAPSPGEKVATLAEAADIASAKMDRPREAIQFWNEVLQIDDREPRALAALGELYSKERRWPALAEVYARQADAATDGEERIGHLRNLAEIYATEMGVPDRALDTWREILALDPDDAWARTALQEALIARGDWQTLESMFSAAGAWEEYAKVLHAAAERAGEVGHKVQLFGRLAELQENRLGDAPAAARTRERILGVDGQNRAAAEALIPYYRAEGRWQKLLDVYQVMLASEPDAQAQKFLVAEICRISEKELNDPARAFSWQRRAFRQTPDSDDVRNELVRLASASDSWEELAAVLAEALEALQGQARAALLDTLGEVELRLGRWTEARAHYEELRLAAPDDPRLLTALGDVYTHLGDHAKLIEVWRARVRRSSDVGERRDLLRRLAEGYEEVLEQPEEAAATWRELLQEAPADVPALKALERLYRRLDRPRELYEVALARLDHVPPDERAAHLAGLGSLARARLGDAGAALRHYGAAIEASPAGPAADEAVAGLAALLDDPTHRVAAAEVLGPIYEARGAWAELARCREVQRAQATASGATAQARLHADLGKLYEERLGEPPRALEEYRQAWLLDPTDADVEQRLRRLSFAQGSVEELALTYEEVLGRTEDPVRKAALAAGLAALYEDALGDAAQARRWYEQVLRWEPDHGGAALALERLYAAVKDWPSLLALRKGLAERTTDPARRLALLRANAALYDEGLDQAAAAAAAYREIFDLKPDDADTARALERLYARSGQWADLVALLERRSGVSATAEERAALDARLGQIYENELHDVPKAAEHYLAAHAEAPGLAEVVAALERLMGRASPERARIAEALEPWYVEQAQHDKLVHALEARLEGMPPGEERRELLGRVAELREELLADPVGALGAWRRALRESPTWEHARAELLRLAERSEAWGAVVEAFEEVLAAADAGRLPPGERVDPELRAELCGHVARAYETKLGDRPQAAAWYRKLLDADPEDAAAVEALERVYVAQEDWRALVGVLSMRAQASADPGERRSIWLRVGQIHEELTLDTAAAIAAYEAIAADDPTDQEALRALEHLYRTEEKYPELVQTLRRRVTAGPPPGS